MPSLAPPRLAVVVATIGLAACATYSPGSFTARGDQFTGQTTTIGCLDLAVDGQRDPIAAGPVVAYQFGNRCDHAIHVDLSAVTAVGRTASGERVALVAFDPERELSSQKLEARGFGRERLEYRIARDHGVDLVEVCLDVGAVTEGGQPAQVCVSPGPGRVGEVAR